MKWNKSRKDLAKNSLAIFVVLVVSVIGVKLLMSSQAAVNDTLSLTSTATSVTPGSTFAVTIVENSGTTPVNSVQASLNYDPAQLQYVSMTNGTAFPTVAANSTATPGVIRVGRAAQGAPVTGSNNVVTLTFRVLASSGTVGLTFDKNFSFLVDSITNLDILGTVIGATYTVAGTSTASASMSLNPGSGNQAAGSTFTVAVRANSGTTPVNSVQSSVTYNPAQLQYVSMTEGNTFTTQAATDTGTAGRVRVARSLQPGSTGVTGDNPIVTLSFRVLAASGTTAVAIDKAQSFVVSSSSNADILTTVAGATYTVTSTPPPGGATLSMSPLSGSFAPNSTISVTISATSPTALMTTVQSAINYPAAQLQYVSTTEGGVFTTMQRTNATTPGLIDIVRAIPGGDPGLTGTHPVVTINFLVIGTSGTAALSYSTTPGRDAAIYDNSGTGTNILNRAGSTAATYTVATTPPPTCAADPSVPGSLTRTASDYTTVSLSWTASTPGANCTLSGYQIRRDGIQVGTVPAGTTSFTNTGLTSGTSYNYTVRAIDTAGRTSGFSTAVATATQADNVSPSTPVGVTAAAPNASTVNLSWTASTDFPNPGGTGVAGYRLFRNNATTPTYTVATGTTFSDTNVTADTLYSYTVRAYDTVGNQSAPSNIVSARTAAAPVTCTGNPTTPTTLTAGTSTLNTTTLTWSPSTAATACTLAGYRVFRDNVLVGSPSATTFTDSGLAPGTSYNYTVQSYDTAAHNSTISTVRVIATAADTTAPSAPTSVTATAVSPGQVNIGWAASTDNIAVTNYRVYRGGTLVNTALPAARTFNDTTVVEDTAYTYTVSAVDAAGNESTRTPTTPASVRTPISTDTQAPTVPGSLRPVAITTTSVALTWNASTDNRGIAGYHVYRGGVYIGDSIGLNYVNNSLAPASTYSYTVRAFDAAGNNSAATAALSVTTQALPVVLIGDLDSDGDVDIFDLSIMMTHWQEVNVPVRFGDIDQDGRVDVFDLSTLLSHLGERI